MSVKPSRPLNRSMIRFHLKELLFRVLVAVAGPDDVVGARPEIGPELPHVGVGGRLGDEADVAALVVVDVHQRVVDGLDAVADELLVLVELGGEAGDVPDGVLVEVVLELLSRSGGGRPRPPAGAAPGTRRRLRATRRIRPSPAGTGDGSPPWPRSARRPMLF